MNELKIFIENYTILPSNDWKTISKGFKKQKFKKNEIILHEGKICRYFFFLESGLLRYYYNIDGNEVVKTFTFSPFCFTSEASFINRRPSNESIQAIEESVVWQIDYEQYNKLNKLESWNTFTNNLLIDFDMFLKLMIIQLKTQTPEQRYNWLIQNYPQSILQKIPQRYLASFLGIAPQSLCRIKNKIHSNRKS